MYSFPGVRPSNTILLSYYRQTRGGNCEPAAPSKLIVGVAYALHSPASCNTAPWCSQQARDTASLWPPTGAHTWSPALLGAPTWMLSSFPGPRGWVHFGSPSSLTCLPSTCQEGSPSHCQCCPHPSLQRHCRTVQEMPSILWKYLTEIGHSYLTHLLEILTLTA